MPWDFRVMRMKYKHPITKEDEYTYGMHEVYFDVTGEPGDLSYTKEAVNVSGDSVEDVRWMLEAMLKALDKPVLDYENDADEASLGSEPRKDENSGEGVG